MTSELDKATQEITTILKKYHVVGALMIIGIADPNHIATGSVLVSGDTNYLGTILKAAKLNDDNVVRVLKVAMDNKGIYNAESLSN